MLKGSVKITLQRARNVKISGKRDRDRRRRRVGKGEGEDSDRERMEIWRQ